MDYTTQQEIHRKVAKAVEAAENYKNLMEAIARRHAELDQKLMLLDARMRLLEEILAPQIQAKGKTVVGEDTPQKKGFFSRLVGGKDQAEV